MHIYKRRWFRTKLKREKDLRPNSADRFKNQDPKEEFILAGE